MGDEIVGVDRHACVNGYGVTRFTEVLSKYTDVVHIHGGPTLHPRAIIHSVKGP